HRTASRIMPGSPERFAHTAEEPLAMSRVEVLRLQRAVQPLDQIALVLVEVGRHDDLEDDPLAAPAAAAETRQAGAANPVLTARLGAGGDLDVLVAVERWHGHGHAQHRLGGRDPDDVDEVGAVALEALVGGDGDLDVEVAGRRPGLAGVPGTGDAQALTVF